MSTLFFHFILHTFITICSFLIPLNLLMFSLHTFRWTSIKCELRDFCRFHAFAVFECIGMYSVSGFVSVCEFDLSRGMFFFFHHSILFIILFHLNALSTIDFIHYLILFIVHFDFICHNALYSFFFLTIVCMCSLEMIYICSCWVIGMLFSLCMHITFSKLECFHHLCFFFPLVYTFVWLLN